MKTDGLQSREWTGYFDESRDIIMGSWRRCMICKKIPADIRYDSRRFFTIWHCPTCREKNYKPKNWWQKFWMNIDKKCGL